MDVEWILYMGFCDRCHIRRHIDVSLTDVTWELTLHLMWKFGI